MKLSIIIPVYNEEQTIGTILEKVTMVKLPCQKEIIIIDDASTDNTGNQIEKCIENQDQHVSIKSIKHKRNRGKGAAIQNGIKVASGEYTLIQDADLEYDPYEIVKLLKPVIKKTSQFNENIAVYGSRFKTHHITISPMYLLGNKFLTFVTNMLYGVQLTDMETGYKLLPTSFLKSSNIQSNHFNLEPEITAKLIKKGIKIIEVPISYKGRTHLAGKKITPLDAYEAIKALVYFRFFN